MATQAETLDKDAFMRLVTEERLQVEGPVGGYLYTGRQGKNGWEVYKCDADVGSDVFETANMQVGTTADPTANAEPATITVPAGKKWRFYGCAFTLVTDANIANRTISCAIQTSGVVATAYATSAVAQTASTTKGYRFVMGKTQNEETDITSFTWVGLGISPYFELMAGGNLVFAIANKQVGDNASSTTYYYKELNA